MITGLTAWVLLLATAGALVVPLSFVAWCFIEEWKRKRRKENTEK